MTVEGLLAPLLAWLGFQLCFSPASPENKRVGKKVNTVCCPVQSLHIGFKPVHWSAQVPPKRE